MTTGQPVLAELKIPADPQYILAAKRTSEAVGAILGFGLEELDDLKIAVAQACESAMEACRSSWGFGCGQLKLSFRATEHGMSVEVRACDGPRTTLVRENSTPAGRPAQAAGQSSADQSSEMVMHLIRCFVDELRYSTDAQGAMRVRMVKRRLA